MRLGSLQTKVGEWIVEAFGDAVASDAVERNRFLEESLELVQALGCTRIDAHTLVDYVFERPVDEAERCWACNGRGYILCACWPGDCICGYGDETCDECGGEGWFYEDEYDYGAPDQRAATR